MIAPPYKVFLSHSSEDVGVAKLLHNHIIAVGAGCFIDIKHLRGGVSFEEELMKQIRSCDEMLLLYSLKFKDSKWMLIEVAAAIGAGKLIVPMLLDVHADKIAEVPYMWRMQAIHIDTHEEYFQDLQSRVNDFKQKKSNIKREFKCMWSDERSCGRMSVGKISVAYDRSDEAVANTLAQWFILQGRLLCDGVRDLPIGNHFADWARKAITGSEDCLFIGGYEAVKSNSELLF